jgi:hypothetical protein
MFEFDKLVTLLGRSESDAEVRDFFEREMSNIERNEYYGFLEFKPDGVAVVFNEAPWVIFHKNRGSEGAISRRFSLIP